MVVVVGRQGVNHGRYGWHQLWRWLVGRHTLSAQLPGVEVYRCRDVQAKTIAVVVCSSACPDGKGSIVVLVGAMHAVQLAWCSARRL